MFRRPKAVQAQASFAGRFVFVAAVIAVALTLITMLTVGSAQACPSAKETNGSVSIVRKTERAATPMPAVAIPASADKLSFSGGYCCKDGSDRHGEGCAGACGATCLSVIGVASSMLLPHYESIRHPLPIQAGAISTEPPPDLRPPRILF